MYQINFRVGRQEKVILEKIAEFKQLSLAELSKRLVLGEIEHLRVDMAFELMNKGKMGKKEAFIFSGLTYFEFMREGAKRNITEKIPDELMDNDLEELESLDLSKLLKTNFEEIKKPLL